MQEEFWTVTVQPSKPLKVAVKDEDDIVTHITQVALGPTKSADPVVVSIELNGESYILGTLIKGVVTEFAARARQFTPPPVGNPTALCTRPCFPQSLSALFTI